MNASGLGIAQLAGPVLYERMGPHGNAIESKSSAPPCAMMVVNKW